MALGDVISSQNPSITHLSDVTACQNCDRIFHYRVLYNFHLKNAHPTNMSQASSKLENENSQNLVDPTLKTISLKEERHAEKKVSQVLSNKTITNNLLETKEQASSSQPDLKETSRFETDSSFELFEDEPKIADQNLSQTSGKVQRKLEHKKSKRFNCQICTKYFSCQTNLELHVDKIHQETKKIECPICNKCFRLKIYLKRHIAGVHAREKKFECHLCKKCFALTNNLRGHIRMVHENVRHFKCSVCKKSFHLNDGLQNHIAACHLTEKPFKCDMCGSCWGNEKLLKNHIARSHDQSKPQECQICKIRCANERSLNVHVGKRHKPQNHSSVSFAKEHLN